MMRFAHLVLVSLLTLTLSSVSQANHINTSQCGGPATFDNPECGTDMAYFRLCLGKDGAEGKAAFKLRPGGKNTRVVPRYTTYSAACKTPPPDVCPGEVLNLDSCS